MARLLEGSRFEGKEPRSGAEIFWFRKEQERFAVCWTRRGTVHHEFAPAPRLIVGRDGEERPAGSARIGIEEKPQYVFTG
jgi:hypothetical protein